RLVRLTESQPGMIDFSGRDLAKISSPDRVAISLAVSRSGKRIALGFRDGTVEVWDPTSGKSVCKLQQDEYGTPDCLAFGRDEQFLAFSVYGKAAGVWKLDQQKPLWTFPKTETILRLDCSPDGKTIATSGDKAPLSLWDAANGRLLRRIEKLVGNGEGLTFSP